MIAPSVAKRLRADTPLGRYGQPDEFAHFACAVIENGYINGVTLRIDGAIKMSNF
jgi:NAD(P)-dependent dehydrogenase (short-subunit alcohol dehydrogenase family)